MKRNFAGQLGFWASALAVVLGVIYLFLLVFHFSTEGFVNPTSGFVPLAAGISMLLLVQVLVILFTAIHYVNDEDNKILGSLGVSFATLCAAAVSINRFVQLTVIQQSLPNVPSDLTRFLPYGEDSVMYSLEWLGWGFFSSLAAVFVAPLFSSTLLSKVIRRLFVLYAIISFIGLIGFMTNTPIASIAFLAWGPILLTLSILLSIYFRNFDKQDAPPPDYPRSIYSYDFKVSYNSQSLLISWSSGTGDIGPTLFELAGNKHALELAMSGKLGILDENELVFWGVDD